MIHQQVLQIVFWLGVIMCLPAFYRLVCAASALFWRKFFPTKIVELRIHDEELNTTKVVTITLDKKRRKSVMALIDDATAKDGKCR